MNYINETANSLKELIKTGEENPRGLIGVIIIVALVFAGYGVHIIGKMNERRDSDDGVQPADFEWRQ